MIFFSFKYYYIVRNASFLPRNYILLIYRLVRRKNYGTCKRYNEPAPINHLRTLDNFQKKPGIPTFGLHLKVCNMGTG